MLIVVGGVRVVGRKLNWGRPYREFDSVRASEEFEFGGALGVSLGLQVSYEEDRRKHFERMYWRYLRFAKQEPEHSGYYVDCASRVKAKLEALKKPE